MHIVDYTSHLIWRCVGQDAVPKIKDMSRAAIGSIKNIIDLKFEFAPGRQQKNGIQIPLDRSIVADAIPGLVNRQAPVDADDIAAAGSYFFEIGCGPRTKVDSRHASAFEHGEEFGVVRSNETRIVGLSQSQPSPRLRAISSMRLRSRPPIP